MQNKNYKIITVVVLVSLLFGAVTYVVRNSLLDNSSNTAAVVSAITTPPELPRVWVDTTMPVQTGATVNVANNCTGISNCLTNLQTAIDNALPGDTIILKAGDTFAGTFYLRNKSNPNNKWIVIESSKMSSLPPQGVRVSLADAVNMPTITAGTSGNPPPYSGAHLAIQALNSSNYYRFNGIRFTPTPGWLTSQLINIGENYPQASTIAQLPHHIVFDRVIVSADPNVGGRRGFRLDGRMQAVINSYVNGWRETGADSQAIASVWGADGFKIVNNYLEGAGENLFFGGGGGIKPIPNINPSDMEIRNNYFYKPISWKTGGTFYVVKNIFEVKAGERILFEGNVLDASWAGEQDGMAINLKSTNQDGWGDNTFHTGDVTMRYNIIRNVGMVASLNGIYPPPAQVMSNVEFSNNIVERINISPYSGRGDLFLIGGGIPNLAINHNTIVSTGAINSAVQITTGMPAATNFDMNNNIYMHGAYGIKGAGLGSGDPSLVGSFSNYTFTNNAAVGGAGVVGVGTINIPSLSSVGFADLVNGDYRIVSGPLMGSATDGKDRGADVAMVMSKTAGVVSGNPSGTYTPPPPTSPTTPAPTLSFSASPNQLSAPATSRLTWSSTNATSCTASGGYGWSGSQPVSGYMDTLSISNTVTFTLTCTGAGGSVTQSATVTYTGSTPTTPAPTLSLSVNPTQISTASIADLTWSSTNATSCTASGSGFGWTGTQPTSGSFVTWHITSTANFTLTCTGAGGSVTKTATVTFGTTAPTTPAPTLSFSANPNQLTAPTTVRLTWSSTNATSCTASGGDGWNTTQPTSGYKDLYVSSTVTFNLTCTGAGGSVTQSAIVTYNGTTPPPTTIEPEVTIYSTPSLINQGSSSIITWSSANMTSCVASGGWTGNLALKGNSTVTPSVSTTYTVTCSGEYGTRSASTLVSVLAPDPTPTDPPYVPPTNTISIGDPIEVIVSKLNVRARPTIYSQRVGVQYEGNTGVTTNGPMNADGYKWWMINFTGGADGWAADEFIQEIGSAPTAISVGSLVRTTENVNVRSSPGLLDNKLGRQQANSQGTIIGGPVSASGYTWWNVDFLNAPDGWVADGYLR